MKNRNSTIPEGMTVRELILALTERNLDYRVEIGVYTDGTACLEVRTPEDRYTRGEAIIEVEW